MKLWILCVALVIALFACKQKVQPVDGSGKRPIDTVRTTVEQPEQEPLRVGYHLMPLNDSLLKSLNATFDSTQLATVLALNRIDLRKVRRNDSLVVPDTFVTDFNAYAPFPLRVTKLDSVRKILLCSYPLEAFGAYEHGRLLRWGPTSMGKRSTPTPTGLFHTNWKAKRTLSTVDSSWVLNWYFNLTNFGGVSLHQYELPGYPASHSCVRLKEHDAKWIYYWAQQWKLTPDERKLIAYGTPVIIFGSYDYNERAPWKKLAHNPASFAVSENALTEMLEPHLPTIMQRQAQRDSVEAGLVTDTLGLRAALH